jgi:hypothetical protein
MGRLAIAAVGLALVVGIVLGAMAGDPFGSPLEASAAKRPERAAMPRLSPVAIPPHSDDCPAATPTPPYAGSTGTVTPTVFA